MVLAFAGRRPGAEFPLDAVEGVRRQVGLLVERIEPRVAVGSAAAGADQLIAEAAGDAGARLLLLLAGDRQGFKAGSVADKGPEWASRFDALLRRPEVAVTEVPIGDDPAAGYRAVTRMIVERAQEVAATGEEIAVLTVLGTRREEGDHTAELVEKAKTLGWQTFDIDPNPPSAETR
jgi:hypothetical protein